MSARAQSDDAEDLEALFDSIAEARSTALAAPAQASPPAPGDVMARIGRIARALNDSLRALNDAEPVDSASRDRLAYVATMSGKAAEKALNAAEMAKPIQDKMGHEADQLTARWDDLFAAQPGVDEFKALVGATREFLRAVPGQTRATNAELTAIMLAQDFHDLTGQVLGRVGDVVRELDRELVTLVAANAPPASAAPVSARLHETGAERTGRPGLVAGERQVDELLESMGF